MFQKFTFLLLSLTILSTSCAGVPFYTKSFGAPQEAHVFCEKNRRCIAYIDMIKQRIWDYVHKEKMSGVDVSKEYYLSMRIRINEHGQLINTFIQNTSGNQQVDKLFLQAARTITAFPPPNRSFSERLKNTGVELYQSIRFL